MRQYFVTKVNGNFILNDEDYYHLKVVLRTKDNDEVRCIYNGKTYLCRYKSTKDSYILEEICELKEDKELKIDIALYQALIRNENFDLVIQKATELGAHEIIPTVFKRNVVEIKKDKEESKLKRYNLIAKSASEQSNRTYIPEVLSPVNVKDIKLEEGEIGLVAWEKEENTKSLSEIKTQVLSSSKIKIVIGPEGGITMDEFEQLKANGFTPISLGNRILRSETATISLLSILNYMIDIE